MIDLQKKLLFERMNIIAKMAVNEDMYAEKSGQRQGIIENMVFFIDSAIEVINEDIQEINNDNSLDNETKAWIISMFETINKRLINAKKTSERI